MSTADKIATLRQPDRPESATWDRGWYDAITAATHTARQSADEVQHLRDELEAIANLAYRGSGDGATDALAEIHRRAREALGKEG